jgi:trigger factor
MVWGFESPPAHQQPNQKDLKTMAVTVETLEKLKRRITLNLAVSDVNSAVQTRLKHLARTIKADGFRPGKVPMSLVIKRYGDSVQYETVDNLVRKAFTDAAAQSDLRMVSGSARLTEADASPEGQLVYHATFEVFPDIALGDLSSVEIERVTSEVSPAAIDKTIDILRKQRRSFKLREGQEVAAEGDQVTIDFEGKIDGVAFDGGKADAFIFILGEGQMLEAFDKAVRGMKTGESKTFPLQFPADYQGAEVAGKEADFMVTLNKVESPSLPELDDAFIRSLGIEDGSPEALRTDIQRNLEREVKFRLLARNKSAAMDALIQSTPLDLPETLVEDEIERMSEAARENLKKRGMKNVDKVPIPEGLFNAPAEKRIRLGLLANEAVRAHQLQAKPEQLQAHIEELAQSYENPAEIVGWYLSDRQRMREVEDAVMEKNLTEFVLSKAKVVEKSLPFDELMAS